MADQNPTTKERREDQFMRGVHRYTDEDIKIVRLIRQWMPPGTADALAVAKAIFDGARRDGYRIGKSP